MGIPVGKPVGISVGKPVGNPLGSVPGPVGRPEGMPGLVGNVGNFSGSGKAGSVVKPTSTPIKAATAPIPPSAAISRT
ncbi:hypothetical protein AR457_02715 [Streptomyces agglomeratus]|nr:hypothetical protein AR457_02715 [Streptomyces agglomeratus]OEJ54913.1 hypothetical protein BGK72_33060 [Streptomyces agglomeratus]